MKISEQYQRFVTRRSPSVDPLLMIEHGAELSDSPPERLSATCTSSSIRSHCTRSRVLSCNRPSSRWSRLSIQQDLILIGSKDLDDQKSRERARSTTRYACMTRSCWPISETATAPQETSRSYLLDHRLRSVAVRTPRKVNKHGASDQPESRTC